MAELENNDPRVTQVLHKLVDRLSRFVVRGRALTGTSIHDMDQIIQDERSRFKAEHGYDFPPIKPFVLSSVGYVIWYRTDLEDKEIRNKMILLLRQFARNNVQITAFELAQAVQSVWPHYRPPVEDMRKDPKLKYQLQ